MAEPERPTLYAPATPPGRGAVAVLRLSGRRAGAALESLTGRSLPRSRHATLVTLRDPADGTPLDRGLALWFPAPASYTGEDVVELHLHGGRAVTASVLACLGRLPGLRLAEPGAFTRRAFEAGKLDLTQAEAIADLVDAETGAQQRQALRQLSGELGRLYEDWRDRLVRSLAHLEAALDFPDEALPVDLARNQAPLLTALRDEIRAHLADGRQGERLRDGVTVAILGPPNAGKSSLLNAMARRDVAIVSERAGTTRDVIEVHVDLGGLPVVLADTAGLRDTDDEIEQAGIARARARAAQADLRIVIVDGRDGPEAAGPWLDYLGPESLCVVNKIDLLDGPPPAQVAGCPALPISARTGAGLDRLLAALEARVAVTLTAGGGPALTRARHREALLEGVAALDRALAAPTEELMAEDVRLAARALGRITGRVDVEDLLDVIFRDFCLGK